MDRLGRRGPGSVAAWNSSAAAACSVSGLDLHTVQQEIVAVGLLLSLQGRTAERAVEDTFPVLFGKDLVKQGCGRDRCRRNAAMLWEVVQVKLLPVSSCQTVVGHTFAVVAVVAVTDMVIVIETAHYQRSDYNVLKQPSDWCFTYFPG